MKIGNKRHKLVSLLSSVRWRWQICSSCWLLLTNACFLDLISDECSLLAVENHADAAREMYDDQPLDLSVKKMVSKYPCNEIDAVKQSLTPSLIDTSSGQSTNESESKNEKAADALANVAIKENCILPKKRSWVKIEEEEYSFPHEIEEWKNTFASGLCRFVNCHIYCFSSANIKEYQVNYFSLCQQQ